MRLHAGRRVRRLRESLGTAGLIVGVVALVAALAGVAFAAGGGLNPTQKKEVKKIAKQFAGKNGATGPAGPAGSNGANGKDGAAGPKGATGAQGPTGEEGQAGEEGPTGPTGSPWVAGGTLPEGATETGTWTWGPFNETYPGLNEVVPVALSFPIPLAAELPADCEREEGAYINPPCRAHLILSNGEELVSAFEPTQPSTECLGSVKEPSAKPGSLCVYLGTETPFSLANFGGKAFINTGNAFLNATGEKMVGTTGINFQVEVHSNGAKAAGSWAVTAE